MTDVSAIVEALRLEVPPQIDEYLPHEMTPGKGRCLPSTRIGIEALAYFGVDAKPAVTMAMAGNAAWCLWIGGGAPMPMPDDVWSVGIDPVDNGDGGYPAHVVVQVGQALIDLDARFISRPAKGMPVPDTVIVPVARPWEILDGGGLITYKLLDEFPPFKRAGDWRRAKKQVGPVIRRMRARLEGGEG